ncbi:sigma 54-interacting transcriptional regulator [Deltaproteobacteria bacterium OttesenSCG-928-M10]|nr:sigma 54-interacting transcriptional regulator [Deltaproteobacteria bacterium OttesenSCG-928-M10]
MTSSRAPEPASVADPRDLTPGNLNFLSILHQHLPAVLYCSSYQDNRWTIRYASEEIKSVMGYAPDDVVGKYAWIDLAQDSDSFYETIPKKSGQPSVRYHLTLKMRCADGEWKTFSDDGVFLYDEKGVLAWSVGIFVDITTQREAEEAMALEYRRLKNLIKKPISLFGIVGNSASMQEVFSRIIKLAASTANVVITGESGTGKELAARAIHHLSNRAGRNFVAVNCGSVSDNLFESEFFGHVKGAFTGALSDRKGYLDLADGGTIFLDEVGEISPGLQAKLLRALDGYGYLPVGGSSTRGSNFRLIAATNRDLQQMVREGTMRKDFYFRIKTFNLQLPPLRERKEDIPLLAHYFMQRLSASRRQTITLDILEHLNQYSWPGNVRELQNVIYRYATFQELGLEDLLHLPAEDQPESILTPPAPPAQAGHTFPVVGRPVTLVPNTPANFDIEGADKNELLKALHLNMWNVSRTADRLGLSRATVYRKMKQWGLERPGGSSLTEN